MSFTSNRRSPWGGGTSTTPQVTVNRRTRVQLAAVIAGLIALASQLPSPSATFDMLFGRSAVAGAIVDTAMLSVAAASVWLLLGWLVLVSAVAAGSRLPGVIGSAARAGLVLVTPVALRNVVLTVVGASVVTGLAGCTTASTSTTSVASSVGAVVTVQGAAVPEAGSPACAPASVSANSGSASQLRAERLIGIATLRISDQIAVEGSAVGSGDPAPTAGVPAGPSVDWPVTSAMSGSGSSGSASSASGSSAPASPASATPTTPEQTAAAAGTAPTAKPAAPEISVDWPGPPAAGAGSADGSVVVLRGDSLWSIAARSLPAGADNAAIDRTWRAWYAANTSVIGSDPNYLLPGQILQPPTLGTGTP